MTAAPHPRTLDETNFHEDDQSLRACLQGERVAPVLGYPSMQEGESSPVACRRSDSGESVGESAKE